MLKIFHFIFLVVFFIAKPNQFSNQDNLIRNTTISIIADQSSLITSKTTDNKTRFDSIAIYYRECKLVKCAKIIYELEPKLNENSYEMGVLVFYKALLFEDINDEVNYEIQANRLANIAKHLPKKDQSILLQCYVIGNQIEAEFQKNNKKEVQRLLQKVIDTLDHVSPKNRISDFYFQKGRAYHLLSNSWVEFNNLKKADSLAELSLKYFDSTSESDYNRAYYYKSKGLIKANEKKPNEAIAYYHKVLDIANKNKAKRFLRNVYPMLNVSYNELGDFESASKYLLKYKMENDSLTNEQKRTTQFIIKKEKENVEKQDLKKKILFTLLSILVLGIVFFVGRYFWKKFTSLEQQEKNDTQENPYADVDNISQEDLAQLVALSKNDENAFYIKFVELNPKLYQQLNNFEPKLSDSEIKFCSYLSMKYTVKEIALYTNTSIKSVESKKYRLKKKLKDSADESLTCKLNLHIATV